MTQATVLCTLPMDPAGAALLDGLANIVTAPDPGPETLRKAIRTADILLVRTMLPADLFDQPNRLIGVVRNGTGLDFIPVAAATAHGIPVANVPGANAQAVVEYCIGNFLLLARRFEQMHAALRSDSWEAARKRAAGTMELAGKTVGIIGLGAIGGALARACKDGFGMHVIGYQPNIARMPPFVEPVDLDTLFARSDFISLNCPLTPETRHLANADRLRRMKRTAVLVNAARGAVVDEQALAVALREGWLQGAAVDVFSEQPIPRDHPLLGLDNVVLTPHAASLTVESAEKMSIGAARQIIQLLRGERPTNLVNPEVWARYEQRRQRLNEQQHKGEPQ